MEEVEVVYPSRRAVDSPKLVCLAVLTLTASGYPVTTVLSASPLARAFYPCSPVWQISIDLASPASSDLDVYDPTIFTAADLALLEPLLRSNPPSLCPPEVFSRY
ncbi:hypothetical protein JCM11641_002707 [Rhodosporidiobolus odoratus]